jgi:arylsulfatase A-like enzyme
MRILYIDIDSLRPSHLGCYGYHRNTSPNIDQIAVEGICLSQVYATDTPCLPSRTAFFGGRFGTTTGVVNHGGLCSDLKPQGQSREFRSRFAENTLASCLSRAGFHTASISPFPRRHSAYQMTYGFHETFDTGKGGLENADEIYPHVKDWLDRKGEEDDWFLHVNFWDPHTPYDTPAEFGNPFEGEPIKDWVTQEIIDEQRASYGPHSATEVPEITNELPDWWTLGVGEIHTPEDAKKHIDGYDAGVLYADLYIGKIIADLKRLGIYDETAIIIGADHGENLGELNVWGDHQTADEHTNHIPMIIRWPEVTDHRAGQDIEGLVYHLDIPKTILSFLGEKAPEEWSGMDLSYQLAREEKVGRDRLVISQGAWSCQRSARWDNWILIRTFHTGMKEYPSLMLFDLDEDLHETNNLAEERPDLVYQGLMILDEWMGERMPEAEQGDPFFTVIQEGGPLHARYPSQMWNKYCDRLRETGRAAHADWLMANGGRPRE